jgi:DNA repair exonuclease SbcCD ATPase subunit
MDELAAVADRLYAGTVDGFTDARNAAAREVEDKALAARIKKLKKPSVAAWAVNLLVRRESGQIDSVLALAESLRAAAEALDGNELRALTRQRRQLTTALASTARSLAHEAGVRLTGPVVEQVESMLTAAMLDPVAAQVIRTGRVLTAFTSTGVSELDVESVVALPESLDLHAVPVEAPVEGDAPVALRVVPDDGARLAGAEEALEEATAQVTEAEQELAEVEQSMESLNARRLQLQGEADELKRRLAAIDDDVDQVDDELEEAEEARGEAQGVVEEARRARAAAEKALARLRQGRGSTA